VGSHTGIAYDTALLQAGFDTALPGNTYTGSERLKITRTQLHNLAATQVLETAEGTDDEAANMLVVARSVFPFLIRLDADL
jgi:hypothetical protein